jgi:hypothetical protein
MPTLFRDATLPPAEVGGDMSLAHRILYATGFTPWEQMAHPQIANQIAEGLDRRVVLRAAT